MYSPVFVFFLISYPSSKCGSKLVTFINHESMYPTVISHFLINKKKKKTLYFFLTHMSHCINQNVNILLLKSHSVLAPY